MLEIHRYTEVLTRSLARVLLRNRANRRLDIDIDIDMDTGDIDIDIDIDMKERDLF